MSDLVPESWRRDLRLAGNPEIDSILVVQCSRSWLNPRLRPLRDEIDRTIMAALFRRQDLAVNRIVLHSLPLSDHPGPVEFARFNTEHADWLYRLAATSLLLPATAKLRIHRLIVRGDQRTVGLTDSIAGCKDGRWDETPDLAAALEIISSGNATTPLTGYDVDLDGPFGDADPSIYL